ncbi:MAG: gas vesicle protein [Candidatus Saganbacteria bacterium]|nr:gas vesicle protein [Candidatus Saganbacteria bacterium]
MAKDMGALVKKVREEMHAVTGLPLGSTVEVVKEDGGWKVAIEMVEKKSLPDGMDILATYVAKVDSDGKILDFKRTGLRKRIDTVEGETD